MAPGKRRIINPVTRLSLQPLLILSFVVPIVSTVGLTGYLSFRNGQQAVNELATQLVDKLGNRIESYLTSRLSTAHTINQLNLNAVQKGQIDLQNHSQLHQHFWQQQLAFNTVSGLYYASEQGELVALERSPWGFMSSVKARGGDSQLAQLTMSNGQGQPYTLNVPIASFDPRQLPWYQTARQSGKPAWGAVYFHRDDGDAALPLVMPLRNPEGRLQGFFMAEFRLKDLNQYLNDLNVSPSGQAFILERSGNLVAASSLEKPYQKVSGREDPIRLLGTESIHPLIQTTTRHLFDRFKDLQVRKPQQFVWTEQNQRHFVHVTPYRNELGLDWLVVIVVPEPDFMAQINQNTVMTIGLCVFATLIAMGVGVLTARWLVNPLMRLNRAAEEIAQGNFDQPVYLQRSDEVGDLAISFNEMLTQLKTLRDSLESQVAERTAALAETNRRLGEEINEREQIELALRESEASYRAILEDQTELILRCRVNGTITFANDAFCEYFALPFHEVIGKSYAPVVYEEDRERVALALTGISLSHPVVTLENRVHTPSGVRWTQWNNRGFFNHEGTLIEFQCVGRDVDDRKRAEEALQQSEARMKDILNTAVAAIAYFRVYPDFSREYLYFSEGQTAIFGLTPQELLEDISLWRERVHPEDLVNVLDPVNERVCATGTTTIEYRYHHKDGSLRWISDHLTS
ncbi:MAG: PAS domain S-box protein, partial [Leptolyngbyaceae cyanobacterium bins.59]|nr:PAS domain S-box protein [Leptolyngbyaceae cyanobacterium bins.59]